ncbi:MAG: hypothetical protein M0C28_20655 [Candidatus Moduliflexus flocculans]|nr:hypothetical protein [Candidatus Moduliflexus flocculans]
MLNASDPGLVALADAARAAVDDFRAWLEEGLKTKKGPSGVGVAEYDWYQKNVHLVPYSWAEQLAIAERELERASGLPRARKGAQRRPPAAPPGRGPGRASGAPKSRRRVFLRFPEAARDLHGPGLYAARRRGRVLRSCPSGATISPRSSIAIRCPSSATASTGSKNSASAGTFIRSAGPRSSTTSGTAGPRGSPRPSRR